MRRVLNNAIADAAEGLDAGEGLPFEFFCECNDVSCKRLVEFTVAGYRDHSRSGPVLAEDSPSASLLSRNAGGPTAA